MAKGNLILGTAKNSVGDVVMYRREGAQITRVRVRNVKNPKTGAQSFQRAIMAPIAKFYSPLSVVLERSFEGLSKAKSHNKFNQVNANLARKNKWALAKGTGFFPLPYQLSQGTVAPVSVAIQTSSVKVNLGFEATTDMENTTVGELSTIFKAMGYKDGDVVTFISIVTDGGSGYIPQSAQFEINTTSTVALSLAIPSLVFEDVEAGDSAFDIAALSAIKGFAVIVSRFDGTMWRRSTQSLVVAADIISAVTADAAVAAAIASYGQTAGDGNPLVYLDGDELAGGV